MRAILFPALSLLIGTPALAQFGPAEVLYGNFPGVMSEARFADIDQDGTLDMVCSAPYESAVMWYRGYGTDRHEPGRSAIAGLNTPSSFDLWDLDGDGVDDLVVTVATDDRILWARNNGYGEFPSVDTLLSTMDQPAWVRVADVDGDGRSGHRGRQYARRPHRLVRQPRRGAVRPPAGHHHHGRWHHQGDLGRCGQRWRCRCARGPARNTNVGMVCERRQRAVQRPEHHRHRPSRAALRRAGRHERRRLERCALRIQLGRYGLVSRYRQRNVRRAYTHRHCEWIERNLGRRH